MQTRLISFYASFPPIDAPPFNQPQSEFTNVVRILWDGERFPIGIASTHLFNKRFSSLYFNAQRHYYLTGYYTHSFTEKIALKSIVTVRADGNFSVANVMVSGIIGSMNELSIWGIAKAIQL